MLMSYEIVYVQQENSMALSVTVRSTPITPSLIVPGQLPDVRGCFLFHRREEEASREVGGCDFFGGI